MEISKCLTVSTAHVTRSTMLVLEEEIDMPQLGLCVYEKKDYGFWVHIPEDGDELPDELPDDLLACIRLAMDNGCQWLCLDHDGEVLESLPTYR